jgi:hypothetical protein
MCTTTNILYYHILLNMEKLKKYLELLDKDMHDIDIIKHIKKYCEDEILYYEKIKQREKGIAMLSKKFPELVNIDKNFNVLTNKHDRADYHVSEFVSVKLFGLILKRGYDGDNEGSGSYLLSIETKDDSIDIETDDISEVKHLVNTDNEELMTLLKKFKRCDKKLIVKVCAYVFDTLMNKI